MLSISAKKGRSRVDVEKMADYPDEVRRELEKRGMLSPGAGKEAELLSGAVEDYYNRGNNKTPSVWRGSGGSALGLSGAVNREDHIKTLQGLDPRTGEGLVQGSGTDRRYAWDLTFSAPKSVSIAWATGDDGTRQAIEDAQTRAVGAVIDFIEENFPLARRGKGGVETEKARLLGAVFLHGSSRDLDCQLHSHAMLQNLLQRMDGTFGTIEPKQIYEWKLALGAMYRAGLAGNLKELGFGIEVDRDYFRLAGIPKELEEEFSKRRAEIEAALREKGFFGGKAAEVAALDTRRAKEVLDPEVLRKQWEKIAGEYGVNRNLIERLRTGGREIVSSYDLDRKSLLGGLTAKESVFREKDLFKAVAVDLSHRGRGLPDVEEEVKALKWDPELVRLRGKDGETYFTTREMLELEEGILARARDGKEDRSHGVAGATVRSAVDRFERERGFSLSEEQIRAIDHMTRDPGRLKIVQGWAGAGKSTALTPVRYALEAEGFEVVGCALQGRTAERLEQETGIKSQTIHSLLRELEGGTAEDGREFPPSRSFSSRSVVIVDEAAMNDTRLMARLVGATEKARAMLVLVGDEKQVPPVSAGSPFRTLKRELGFAELTENRRQREEWQREASGEIRAGQVREALARYAEAGMIEIVRTKEEAIRKTVEAWGKVFDPATPERSLLTAFRRADVREMNRLARESMKDKGALGDISARIRITDREGVSREERTFAAGDRLVFLKNSRPLDVKNGTMGTVERIGLDGRGEWTFRVRTDDGKMVAFSPADYGQIDYGYATTIHKSQGATVERSFNLVGGTGLEELYVQLTRQKEGARIVMVEDQLDRAADEAGIDMAPTKRMIDYARDLSRKLAELPDSFLSDFESCRDFLNRWADHQIENKKIDFGLEKVGSLLESLSRSREKANVLDFQVEETRGIEKDRDSSIVRIEAEKEIVSRTETGKSRNLTRERGLELGM